MAQECFNAISPFRFFPLHPFAADYSTFFSFQINCYVRVIFWNNSIGLGRLIYIREVTPQRRLSRWLVFFFVFFFCFCTTHFSTSSNIQFRIEFLLSVRVHDVGDCKFYWLYVSLNKMFERRILVELFLQHIHTFENNETPLFQFESWLLK